MLGVGAAHLLRGSEGPSLLPATATAKLERRGWRPGATFVGRPTSEAFKGGADPSVPAPRPGSTARFEYAPREAGEWQGMLVNLSLQASCDESSRCGLGMACNLGRCGPCSGDGDCASGERCVLQHCIPEENAHCRSRHDCGDTNLCVLSGYSSDARGNAETSSFCLGPATDLPRVLVDSRTSLLTQAPAAVAPTDSLEDELGSPQWLIKNVLGAEGMEP